MLAEASRQIAQQGYAVTLIARRPETLAGQIGAHAVPMDWSKPSSIQAALETLQTLPQPDTLISWIHDRGIGCLSDVETFLRPHGRSIRIHGSSAGDPSDGITSDPAPPPGIIRQNIVLGWIKEGLQKRWLNHEEICAGILDIFSHSDTPYKIIGDIQ